MKRLASLAAFAALTFGAQVYAADAPVEKITFTNKVENGKKVWEPAEAKVHSGHKVEITLKNTLPDPHGFNVPGLASPVIVKGNETKTVMVDAPKAGAYKFNCQLHPAHVGGEIIVQ